MRPTPNCPEPRDPSIGPVFQRVRPRPQCDPAPVVAVPEFLDPESAAALDPEISIPLPYTLGNASLTVGCDEFPAYLEGGGDAPEGVSVTLEPNEVTARFLWTTFDLTTQELDNIAKEQQRLGGLPLAGDILEVLEDSAYFVALGVDEDKAVSLLTYYRSLSLQVETRAHALAVSRLNCHWESEYKSFVCVGAANTTLLQEHFEVALAAYTSTLSQADADAKAQARLEALAVCRYTNNPKTFNCPEGTTGDPVTIPAGTFTGEDASVVRSLVNELGAASLLCLYGNEEKTYTCGEHVSDPVGLWGDNPSVVIPAATYFAATIEEAALLAQAAAAAQIVCLYQKEITVCCCCFPELKDELFDPDAPSDDACAPSTVGSAELGLTCPPARGRCMFLRSGNNPDVCDRPIGSSTPCTTQEAFSYISEADAREIAALNAMAQLVCEHTNDPLIYEECPPGLFAVAPIEIPAGTVTATSMTEANSVARVYALALIQCAPGYYTATAHALCCPFPDARPDFETCENPKMGSAYLGSTDIKSVVVSAGMSTDIELPTYPEVDPPTLILADKGEEDAPTWADGGHVWSATHGCDEWKRHGTFASGAFIDGGFVVEDGQGESSVSMADAIQQAEAVAVGKLNCQHVNVEVTADCCPDVPVGVVAAGTVQARTTLEANMLAELQAEALQECGYAATAAALCCPFPDARPDFETCESPKMGSAYLGATDVKSIVVSSGHATPSSNPIYPPVTPPELILTFEGDRWSAGPGCAVWKRHGTYASGAFIDGGFVVEEGEGFSLLNIADARRQAEAVAVGKLNCQHVNVEVTANCCPDVPKVVVAAGTVQARTTLEANMLAELQAETLQACIYAATATALCCPYPDGRKPTAVCGRVSTGPVGPTWVPHTVSSVAHATSINSIQYPTAPVIDVEYAADGGYLMATGCLRWPVNKPYVSSALLYAEPIHDPEHPEKPSAPSAGTGPYFRQGHGVSEDPGSARTIAEADAVGQLSCLHTNIETVADCCSGTNNCVGDDYKSAPNCLNSQWVHMGTVAAGVVAAGSISARSTLEADLIAEAQARALNNCLYVATARGKCKPFPDSRKVSDLGKKDKEGTLGAGAVSPSFESVISVSVVDGERFQAAQDAEEEPLFPAAAKFEAVAGGWGPAGVAGAIFKDKVAADNIQQAYSTVSWQDAVMAATAAVEAGIDCAHTNSTMASKNREACPLQQQPPSTITEGTFSARSTLEANILAERELELLLEPCCWAAAVTLKCCPYGDRVPDPSNLKDAVAVKGTKSPWGDSALLPGNAPKYHREVVLGSCPIPPAPPLAAPPGKTTSCAVWKPLKNPQWATPEAIEAVGEAQSLISYDDAVLQATLMAQALLDCDHVNAARYSTLCGSGLFLEEAGDVPAGVVRARTTEEANRIAWAMASAQTLCGTGAGGGGGACAHDWAVTPGQEANDYGNFGHYVCGGTVYDGEDAHLVPATTVFLGGGGTGHIYLQISRDEVTRVLDAAVPISIHGDKAVPPNTAVLQHVPLAEVTSHPVPGSLTLLQLKVRQFQSDALRLEEVVVKDKEEATLRLTLTGTRGSYPGGMLHTHPWRVYKAKDDTYTVGAGEVVDTDGRVIPVDALPGQAAPFEAWVAITLDAATGLVTEALLQAGASRPPDKPLDSAPKIYREVAKVTATVLRQTRWEPIDMGAEGGGGVKHPFKITFNADAPDTVDIAAGTVYHETGSIAIPAQSGVAAATAYSVKITRVAASRAVSHALLEHTGINANTRDYQYVHIGGVTSVVMDGVTSGVITQNWFTDISVAELLTVRNGAFQLVPLAMLGTNGYAPPPPPPP